MRSWSGGALAILQIVIHLVAPVQAAEIGPDTDLCAAIHALSPGEELVLEPGDYRAGCVIRQGGGRERPLVIRAADPTRRPRLVPPGRTANMLEIRASDVTIRELEFWGSFADVDGIRVVSGNRITIEGCRFLQMGGIAIAATHTSVRGFTVRHNTITESHATGMYFGCHDGLTCTISNLIVESNRIQGVAAVAGEIGYGLQVKLNSSAVIRDNIVQDVKGPGIMIYGARDLITASLVERNFVSGSRTSAGIVIGGGPVVVRNNVAVGNFEAGIALENYHRRNLLRGIVVAHNTVYGNRQASIAIPEGDRVEASILNNALQGRGSASAVPAPRPGLRLLGNVDCTWIPCFRNADDLDFSPFPGSLLNGAAIAPADGSRVEDDFFGARRGMPASAGAIERSPGPLRPGLEKRQGSAQ